MKRIGSSDKLFGLQVGENTVDLTIAGYVFELSANNAELMGTQLIRFASASRIYKKESKKGAKRVLAAIKAEEKELNR